MVVADYFCLYTSRGRVCIISLQPARKPSWKPAGIEPIHWKPVDMNPGSLMMVRIQNTFSAESIAQIKQKTGSGVENLTRNLQGWNAYFVNTQKEMRSVCQEAFCEEMW